MATIPSTIAEFNKDAAKFMTITGDKRHTQEQVAGAFKCMTLRYLGLGSITPEQLDACAMTLQIMTQGAIARGWDIT
jgi:hypothetical protein